MDRILLCDHQQFTRAGLSGIIASSGIFELVGYAPVDENLPGIVEKLKPHLIIADPYATADSPDQLLQVKAAFPDMRFMIVSNQVQRTDILKFVTLGIKCYVSKNATANELLAGIAAALSQARYFCNEASKQFFMGSQPSVLPADVPSLSVREREIIHLIADGVSDRDIAERLFLSFHTIRTHRKNISKKLGFSLKNAGELMWFISNMSDVI